MCWIWAHGTCVWGEKDATIYRRPVFFWACQEIACAHLYMFICWIWAHGTCVWRGKDAAIYRRPVFFLACQGPFFWPPIFYWFLVERDGHSQTGSNRGFPPVLVAKIIWGRARVRVAFTCRIRTFLCMYTCDMFLCVTGACALSFLSIFSPQCFHHGKKNEILLRLAHAPFFFSMGRGARHSSSKQPV